MLYFSLYPPTAKAATGDAVDDSGVMDSSLSEPYVEEKSEEHLRSELDALTFEVESLREENIKHFQLPDGTYQAVIYGSAVHRLNSDGEWVDLDNSLAGDGDNISASDARVRFIKKITGNENLFTIHDGQYKITVGLQNALKKTEGACISTNEDGSESKLQKLVDLDHISANVVYKDILKGVDLEYVLISNNIKENIIVKEKSDQYSDTFTLKLNGLTAELENNAVYLCDNGTGEILYQIPQPYMYDAAGEMSTDIIDSLTELGNEKYTLSVDADHDWINDEERVFPVTIDPRLSV